MVGNLKLIATHTVSGPEGSVVLEGIVNDSVYVVTINNVQPETDAVNLRVRVTKDVSGVTTAQTTSNYDEAARFLDATTTFGTQGNQNLAFWTNHLAIGNVGSEAANGIYHLYEFNNPSEYSYITKNTTDSTYNNAVVGYQGGGVYTVTEAHNGLEFYFSTGNIEAGSFALYEVI